MLQFIRKTFKSAANKVLKFAVRANWTFIARLSVFCGADVNRAPTEGVFKGRTPLWWATNHNNIAAIKLLIDKGADVNIAPTEGEFNGCTPLLWATNHNNIEAIQLLLDKGADVNIAPTEGMFNGRTPLLLATYHNNVEAIRLLVGKGADVNIAPTEGAFNGHTPLWLAIRNSKRPEIIDVSLIPEVIKLFLMKGARVNTNQEVWQNILLLTAPILPHHNHAVCLIKNAHEVRSILPMLERMMQKKRLENNLSIDLLPNDLIRKVKTMLTG